METAAPLYLSLFRRAQRVYLGTNPPGSVRGQAFRLLRFRRLSVRAALVPRRALRSFRPAYGYHVARYRGLNSPDVLAQRIQPDSRPASPYTLRRETHGQRVSLSVSVLHGRARGAPVLK